MICLRKFAILTVSVFVLVVVGCMSDEANRCYLKLPPKPVTEVQVLREAPQRPYEIVADFQANRASIKHMQKRAAEVGADAVIVVPVGGNYSRDEVWAGQDRYADSYTRMTGTAIRYKTN